MTGNQKKTAKDIEDEMENIFNLRPFDHNEDDDFKLKKNSQMPRGKSSGKSKSPLARSRRGAAKK